MASLYGEGWRQGSLLRAKLRCTTVHAAGRGVKAAHEPHGEWVLVTQECDLDRADVGNDNLLLELRPTYSNDGRTTVGIRSGTFVLDAKRTLRAQSPRVMIGARALHALRAGHLGLIDDGRARLLKTWLGLRYDRPAVPEDYVPLARAVADAVSRNSGDVASHVLDVLMRFEAGVPPRVGLYAVTNGPEHRDEVEYWMQLVVRGIPPEVGTVLETQVITTRQLSLWTIQNTHAADVTALSIPPTTT